MKRSRPTRSTGWLSLGAVGALSLLTLAAIPPTAEAGLDEAFVAVQQLLGGAQLDGSGATNGQALVYNATTDTYEPGTVSVSPSTTVDDLTFSITNPDASLSRGGPNVIDFGTGGAVSDFFRAAGGLIGAETAPVDSYTPGVLRFAEGQGDPGNGHIRGPDDAALVLGGGAGNFGIFFRNQGSSVWTMGQGGGASSAGFQDGILSVSLDNALSNNPMGLNFAAADGNPSYADAGIHWNDATSAGFGAPGSNDLALLKGGTAVLDVATNTPGTVDGFVRTAGMQIGSTTAPIDSYTPGQILVEDGQGAIVHFQGPTDADLSLASGTGITTFGSDQVRFTKEVFHEARRDGSSGNYSVRAVGANSQARFTLFAPYDLTTVVSVTLVAIPTATAAGLDIDLLSDYAAIGEDAQAQTETDLATTYSFTANQVAELDLTPVLSSLAAGDHAGIQVNHNAIGQTVGYVGIRLRYR